MWNARSILMVFVALASGLVAVFLAAKWLAGQGNIVTTKVVVAAHEMPIGTMITKDKLAIADWPRTTVPTGSSSDPAALEGRVTKIGIVRGEPIIEERLAPVGSKAGLASIIGSGKRALSVKVNEVVGVAGFVQPGDYVDVLVNIKEEKTNRLVSKIVLEHMLVLAVAQEAGRDETKPKVVNAVTLEVSPEEAERLDLARSVGTLSLALRNQIDSGSVLTMGAVPADLFSPPPVAQQADSPDQNKPVVKRDLRGRKSGDAQKSGSKVDVIKGVERGSLAF